MHEDESSKNYENEDKKVIEINNKIIDLKIIVIDWKIMVIKNKKIKLMKY